MTLKQLEAFYWAATCANFAMAAERLHLSTSSLSKRLVELEDALGVQLFDRSGHKAVLTEAGERFLPRAGACRRYDTPEACGVQGSAREAEGVSVMSCLSHDCCGAGVHACSGSPDPLWLRLRCSVGQVVNLRRAGSPPPAAA